MKIGVSSYSYSRLVANGTMKQSDVVQAAKDDGFEVIEFCDVVAPEGKTRAECAAELKEEADRVGLPIVNYTVGANLLAEDLDEEIERIKGEVDIAAILGAPGMRHDIAYSFPEGYKGPRDYESLIPGLARACREITEYAATKGIRTMTENHGQFSQDSVRIEKLVSAVDHPNFGVLLDMGNFYCVDENSAEAIGRLAPSVFHVHVKDYHIKSGSGFNPGRGWYMSRGGNYLRGAIIGHGNVPLLQGFRVLKQAGYDGVLSVEFEGMEDPKEGISIGLENLRRLIELA